MEGVIVSNRDISVLTVKYEMFVYQSANQERHSKFSK